MTHLNKYQNQLLFFTALLLSAFGYEFIYFIMTLHVYDLSSSALNLGIFTSLTYVPRLFSTLIGGLSDKLGKAKCFSFSAVMVGVLLLLMSFLTDIAAIYAVWLLAAFFFTVIVNTRGSLMAELVARERYTHGNALSLSLLNAAKLLGPFFGGLIVMLLNIKLLLYFTVLVYLSVAVCSYGIKSDAGAAANRKTSFLENTKKGVNFIAENKSIRTLAAVAFFWRLFLGMQLSLFVIYIKTGLGATSAQYGFFITLMGIGCIAGSMLGPYAAKRVNSRGLIVAGLSLHYFSFAALGLCRDYRLSLAIIFISYMVFYVTLVSMHSLRDRVTAFDIRGSVYGTVTTMLTPPAVISMIAGSFLADRFGVSAVLLWAGLLAAVSLYLILYLGRKSELLSETDQL